MLATCFLAARSVALSRMGSPSIRNGGVSLTVPMSFLLGRGAVSAGIGLIGEAGSFPLGIAIYGGFPLAGVVLVRYLKFANE